MKNIFIETYGWPYVTVARYGFGDSEENTWFGVKGL